MRAVLAVLICLGLAAPAYAAESKKIDTQYVDISPVALPIIADGRLINFVFVTLRLHLSPSTNVTAVRDKEPYFRDALIRTAYRKPFVVPTSYTAIDVPALKARMMGEAAQIAGPGVVVSVEIVGDPQPKRTMGLPRPKGAASPGAAPIP